MPHISYKRALINEIDFAIRMGFMFDLYNDEELDELMDYRLMVMECRTILSRTPIPKNKAMIDMLWQWGEAEFRQETRMTQHSFKCLVRLIEHHPIFHNRSKNPQAHVWEQLFVVLKRLGCEGNGVSVGIVSRFSGVSTGTVVKYSERVITAIYDIGHQLIQWPDENERREISNRFTMNHGLKGAVAIVDGTQVILSQRPHIDGETYWTRKGRYSINLQIVCDDKRMVRSYVVGWPGSVSDSTVFNDSDIYKNPQEYFSRDQMQYIIADAGYASESWLCTPYRQPAASFPQNQLFNELFSSARVTIEHLNGVLKARWSSLRGIRNQLKIPTDFEYINKQIVVCLILHNFLLISNDIWDDEFLDELNQEEIYHENIRNINATNLRAIVQNNLLHWYQTKIMS